MGRSRGGLSTKAHALTDARGLPIKLALTPGQTHDTNGAAVLLTDLTDGGVVLGDKAYDADWIRLMIEAQGAAPNIPDKANRRKRHGFSKTLSCQSYLELPIKDAISPQFSTLPSQQSSSIKRTRLPMASRLVA